MAYELYLKTVRSRTGMLGRQFANDQSSHTNDRQHRKYNDEVRSEPVVFLPFVEHDLQTADAHRQQPNAPEIDAAFSRAAGKGDRR